MNFSEQECSKFVHFNQARTLEEVSDLYVKQLEKEPRTRAVDRAVVDNGERKRSEERKILFEKVKQFVRKHASFDRGHWRMDTEYIYRYGLSFTKAVEDDFDLDLDLVVDEDVIDRDDEKMDEEDDEDYDDDEKKKKKKKKSDSIGARRESGRQKKRPNYADFFKEVDDDDDGDDDDDEDDGVKVSSAAVVKKKKRKMNSTTTRDYGNALEFNRDDDNDDGLARIVNKGKGANKEEEEKEEIDEEMQNLARELGFPKFRFGGLRHALFVAMKDAKNGMTIDDIVEVSEQNGLAKCWQNSLKPKNTICSIMGEKCFTRIGRGEYVLTAFKDNIIQSKDDDDGNKEKEGKRKNTKKKNIILATKEREHLKRQKKTTTTPPPTTKTTTRKGKLLRNNNNNNNNSDQKAHYIAELQKIKKRMGSHANKTTREDDVHHEVASQNQLINVDNEELKKFIEKQTEDELRQQIEAAFEAQEKAEHMQDVLVAKEEAYIQEERKKRRFVEDPEPADLEFSQDEEAFNGDSNDRKALLKHKRIIEEKKKEIDLLREEWRKEQRIKKKKFQLTTFGPIKLSKELDRERRKVLKYANIALEEIKYLASLSKKLDSIRKNEYDYSEDVDALDYMEVETSKRLKVEQALPKLTEEEIKKREELRNARQRVQKASKDAPIPDLTLKRLDKLISEFDNRDPFPDVFTGDFAGLDDDTFAEIEISAFMDYVGRDVTFPLPPAFQSLSYELSNPTDQRLGALFERVLRVAITTAANGRLASLWDRTLELGSCFEILAQYFRYKSKTSSSSASNNSEAAHDEMLIVARRLSETRWKDVSRSNLTHCLRLLCEDCLDSQLVRDAIERRVQMMGETKGKLLQKKRMNKNQPLHPLTKKVENDRTHAIDDLENTEDGENDFLNPNLTERQKNIIEQKRIEEEREIQRSKVAEEEKFNREIQSSLMKSYIRAPELGRDRDGRRYYISIGGFRDSYSSAPIFLIFNPRAKNEFEAWSSLNSIDGIDKLVVTLNEKGTNENALKDKLLQYYESLHNKFQERIRTTKQDVPDEEDAGNNEATNVLKSTRASNEDASITFVKRELAILASSLELHDAPVPQSAANWTDWRRNLTPRNSPAVLDLKGLAVAVNEIESAAFLISDQPKAGAMGRKDVVSIKSMQIEDLKSIEEGKNSDNDDDDDDGNNNNTDIEDDENEEAIAKEAEHEEWWETISPPINEGDDSLATKNSKQIWRSDAERQIWKNVVTHIEGGLVESSAVLAHALAILNDSCGRVFEVLEKEKEKLRQQKNTRPRREVLQNPYVYFSDSDSDSDYESEATQ